MAQIGLSGSVCTLTGCGTLLHGERRGQRHNGQIDWKVAGLNGLGLVFFFVPGVIAFVVDFYTGAIYLPASYAKAGHAADSPTVASETAPLRSVGSNSSADQASLNHSADRPAWRRLGLTRTQLTPDQLTPSKIERIVTQAAGQPVSLQTPDARLSQLAGIEEFEAQGRRHEADFEFGHAVRSFFSKWSPA
ncbi:MAG: hypothetical protein EA381_01355 [Planctomycetaceae bacterium]|nr:MAG: hypothetical protein EA381_01355 [Planctomycetaceae bacterium]